eukprot:9979612-Alexandrium_andersonii.AAC.1
MTSLHSRAHIAVAMATPKQARTRSLGLPWGSFCAVVVALVLKLAANNAGMEVPDGWGGSGK